MKLIGRLSLPCLIAAAVSVSAACGRAGHPPPVPLATQVDGTLVLSGLTAPVRIVRDVWGVPHIYAQNESDLFVAQGFVQAQDRLFQMDLWRRSAQGRLSEVLGPNFIERDAMTRRIQYRGDVASDWAASGADATAIATSFVRGVNAWVALARERPPEQFVLAGWKPEPWSADDLLNRTEAFTASRDALDEVFRARLIATVGAARARLLMAGDRPIDVAAGVDPAAIPDLVADAIRRVGTPPFFLGLAAPVIDGTVRLPASAPTLSTGATARPGRSAPREGRKPDQAPGRTLDHPSHRYIVHLNAPGWNVIGATAPWRPGVAVGHNDRIAWTAEPFDVDTEDIYVEKLNPANPRQVEDSGRWVDIESSKDRLPVRGRKTPVDFERDSTRHGVILAFDRERNLAFALRWAGSEPGTATELGALALDRAASPAEFRAALARWKMPSRRITFLDGRGVNISAIAALVPVRRGSTGALPAPGWNGAAEWAGWRPTPEAAPIASKRRALELTILDAVRLHPDRGDALLQRLVAAASSPDSLTVQRGAVVDALADGLRELSPQNQTALFAHPLAVTEPARRRFNVAVPAPSTTAVDPLAITFDAADWDRSVAINAPGQSESPDSANFADLARLWSEGKSFPLAFTNSAVQAHAAATLVLRPK